MVTKFSFKQLKNSQRKEFFFKNFYKDRDVILVPCKSYDGTPSVAIGARGEDGMDFRAVLTAKTFRSFAALALRIANDPELIQAEIDAEKLKQKSRTRCAHRKIMNDSCKVCGRLVKNGRIVR